MNDHKNALPPGTLLGGRYRIEGLLGAGGFGMVYRVAHRYLDQVHAIKEYLPQELAMREGVTVHPLSTESGVDYEEGRQRFLQEARQLVRFSSHPNIVTCTDFFEANGTAYLVMEYEDGLPLSGLLAGREGQGRPLEESEILGLLRPIVAGLAEVHAQDVLHRDIKPGNIFIRRSDEQPVLLDFGAAKVEFSKHSKSRHA
ncbi:MULTISPECIES: serine/threonine-protein kinase, partial [unclassified Thioalkalivibrio]